MGATRLMRAIDRYAAPDAPLAVDRDRTLTAGRFLGQTFALARRLPDLPYAVNVCADRRSFMAGFIAAMMRGQTTLMPGDTTPETFRLLRDTYKDIHFLKDTPLPLPDDAPTIAVDPTADADIVDPVVVPSFAPDRVATVAFTSGSTGRPIGHEKTWGSLVTNARLAALRFSPDAPPYVVATAPQQHMYGFETSVMLPLQNGGATYAARPFFPEDVATALLAMPTPRILVTTPIHLRAFMASGVVFPPIATVVSATAPLAHDLAAAFEERHQAPVQEIFGCTEAGSIASRRTVEGDRWTPYDGVTMRRLDETFVVDGGHLEKPTPLSDRFELIDGGFIHRGRAEDMVNIGGKRTSLAYLNARLMEVDGVKDGVFLTLKGEPTDAVVSRLAACVVTDRLTKDEILAALRHKLDPIFLPRPLTLVADLMRNENGKTNRARLLALMGEESS